jgi:hypothetical protein
MTFLFTFIAIKSIMLSVIDLKVIILNVMVPAFILLLLKWKAKFGLAMNGMHCLVQFLGHGQIKWEQMDLNVATFLTHDMQLFNLKILI